MRRFLKINCFHKWVEFFKSKSPFDMLSLKESRENYTIEFLPHGHPNKSPSIHHPFAKAHASLQVFTSAIFSKPELKRPRPQTSQTGSRKQNLLWRKKKTLPLFFGDRICINDAFFCINSYQFYVILVSDVITDRWLEHSLAVRWWKVQQKLQQPVAISAPTHTNSPPFSEASNISAGQPGFCWDANPQATSHLSAAKPRATTFSCTNSIGVLAITCFR